MLRTLIWAGVFFGFPLGAIFFAPRVALSQEASDWSGLSVRGGYAFGSGDFSVSHQHEIFSFGELLSVSTGGELPMVGVIYRWSLGSGWYLGAKLDLYKGDLTGHHQNDYNGLKTRVDFTTTLTGMAGGHIGYAFGCSKWTLVYAGGGVAASKTNITVTASYEAHSFQESRNGGAMGPYLELGANYAFTDRTAGFIEIKQVFYEASEECTLAGHNCGEFTAETNPLIFSLGVEIKF